MFIIDLVAIGLFSLLSVFVAEAWQLVAARFFIGVFVGADYPIATSLSAEFTPKEHRSISMGMVSAAWYLGATVAAVVGYGLYGMEDGWKWMLGSAVVPCVVLLIGRHDIPESPLWLASKGRVAEARAVMDRVFGPDVELAPAKPAGKTPLATLMHGEYLKRMVFLGCSSCARWCPCMPSTPSGPRS
ncbi:MAG: MFS transporter [Adlercreutzia sp.]